MARQTNRENCKVRVVAIYRMLQSGKKMTAGQIIAELQSHYGFSADRKTIYHDIAAINLIIPIKSTGGRGGGFILWDVLGESEEEKIHE